MSGWYASYWIHGPGILRDMVDKQVVHIILDTWTWDTEGYG